MSRPAPPTDGASPDEASPVDFAIATHSESRTVTRANATPSIEPSDDRRRVARAGDDATCDSSVVAHAATDAPRDSSVVAHAATDAPRDSSVVALAATDAPRDSSVVALAATDHRPASPIVGSASRDAQGQTPLAKAEALRDEQATRDAYWMGVALHEADHAASVGEVPVGCVLVSADGARLASGRNEREALQNPTAHAEMIAIRAAASAIGSWRLEGVTCFVTLEPCAMCAGALVHARIARVVYGCDDPKGGAVTTLYGIGTDPRLNHRFDLVRGVRADECAQRLRTFFAALRALGKK